MPKTKHFNLNRRQRQRWCFPWPEIVLVGSMLFFSIHNQESGLELSNILNAKSEYSLSKHSSGTSGTTTRESMKGQREVTLAQKDGSGSSETNATITGETGRQLAEIESRTSTTRETPLLGARRPKPIDLAPPVQFPSDHEKVDEIFSKVPPGCGPLIQRFKMHGNGSDFTKAFLQIFDSAPLLRNEHDLYKHNPSSFYRLLDFDDEAYSVDKAGTYLGYWNGELPTLGGVSLFRNAFMQGNNPIVFDCSVAFGIGGCVPGKKHDFDLDRMVRGQKKNPRKHTFGEKIAIDFIDTGVSISQIWNGQFYHDLIEKLPKLAFVHQFLLENPTVKVAMPQPVGEIDLLYNLLNISKSQTYYYWPGKMKVFFRKLLIPSTTPCGRGNARSMQYVNKVFAARIPVVYERESIQFRKMLGDKRLIVLQKRDPFNGNRARVLINHDQLLEALRREFESCCVVMEFSMDTPVSDGTPFVQGLLMHHYADLLVGPHGAGLSWTLLSQPGRAALLELHPGTSAGIVDCHLYTARGLGIHYKMLIADNGHRFSDFSANVTEVVEAARAWLEPRKLLDLV